MMKGYKTILALTLISLNFTSNAMFHSSVYAKAISDKAAVMSIMRNVGRAQRAKTFRDRPLIIPTNQVHSSAATGVSHPADALTSPSTSDRFYDTKPHSWVNRLKCFLLLGFGVALTKIAEDPEYSEPLSEIQAKKIVDLIEQSETAAQAFAPEVFKRFDQRSFFFGPPREWYPVRIATIRHNPDRSIAYVLEKLISHHETSRHDYKNLCLILDLVPGAAKKIAEALIQNSVAISHNKYDICSLLMENDHDTVKMFTEFAIQNFNLLSSSTIITIIELNPDAAKTFAECAKQDFSYLATEKPYVILNIIERTPYGATFIQPAIDNFDNLVQTGCGCKIIESIMNHSYNTAIAFTQPAIDNFDNLVQTPWGLHIIKTIINRNSKAAKTFTHAALLKLDTLIQTSQGNDIIIYLMEHNPDTLNQFEVLVKHNPDTLNQLEVLAQKHGATKVLHMINKVKFNLTISEIFATKSTQSTQHFAAVTAHNLKKLEKFYPKHKKCINAFHKMISYIIDREHIEQKRGNYTFVHAYPWAIHFLQDTDASLRSIITDIPKKPVSLRFIKPPKETTAQKHQKLRTDLLEKGSAGYYAREGNLQKHMIFMNYALLTNQYGSNTLQYIAKDRCENPRALRLNKIFENAGLKKYLRKYHKELDELEKLHRKANQFGAGLMFSFTPKMLKESVYVCYGGGKKRKVHIEGIGKTDDVKLIVDTLRTHPEKIENLDHLEFVFVLTKDCALNPHVQESDAYKVIPFNAADPEKLKLYEQKRDELMAKIKADIKAERAQWTEEQQQEFQSEQKKTQAWYDTYNCLECRSPICESRVQEAV